MNRRLRWVEWVGQMIEQESAEQGRKVTYNIL